MNKKHYVLLLLLVVFSFVGCPSPEAPETGGSVTSLNINTSDIALESGTTETVSVSLSPSGADSLLDWSGDSSIVSLASSQITVDVTGKKPGVTSLKVSDIYTNVEASINVTVTAREFSDATPVSGSVEAKGEIWYSFTAQSGYDYIVDPDFSGYIESINAYASDMTTLLDSTEYSFSDLEFQVDSNQNVYIQVKGESFGGSDFTLERYVEVAVTDVTINGSVDLISGDDLTLTATVEPADATQGVSWSSSDETVAKVSSSGVVLAIRPGSVEITAESTYDDTKTATVALEVSPRAFPVGTTAGELKGEPVYYRIACVSGLDYVIEWLEYNSSLRPGYADIEVSLLDDSFSSVKANDNYSPLGFSAPTTGNYYVKVEPRYSYTHTTGNFELSRYADAESLTISVSELSLELSGRHQLTATIEPAGAKQDVKWSSSNSSIVDVNSTTGEVVTVGQLPGGTAVITAKAKSDDTILNTCTVTVIEPAKKDEWTIMYYSDADNDLEEYLLSDIQEIKNGLQADADINVILLVDRISGYTSNTTILGSDFTTSRLYRILPGAVQRIGGGTQFPGISTTEDTELNMGDANTLKSFVTYCKTEYPADNYALFLSNHGGGSRSAASIAEDMPNKDICYDKTSSNDAMFTAEITDKLTDAESVDLMVFDACLMATAEVAYQYRPGTGDFSADYLLASAPTVWGYGLSYDTAFARINTQGGNNGTDDTTRGGLELNYDPSTITAEELACIFLEEQRDSVNKYEVDSQSLALLDLSKIGAVKTSVDSMAQLLVAKKGYVELTRGSNSSVHVMNYFNESDEVKWISFPYFDLYDLAAEIEGKVNYFDAPIRAAAGAVNTAVDAAVLYSFGGSDYSGFSEGKNGLSIFFPDGDRMYSTDTINAPHWAFHWWYSSLDTAANQGDASKLYGKLAWCIDGQNPATGAVGNWFELLDSWFDCFVDGDGNPININGFTW